jgi:anti-anti-sigma factor
MSTRPAEARVRHGEGVAILELGGEIDGFADAALSAAYAEAEAGNPRALLFNFEAVDYINSAGIALIVELLARARRARRRVLTCGLSDHYREIFEITRLADFMTIYPDEASALAEGI